MFSFDFSIISWVLIGLCFISALLAAIIGLHNMRKFARAAKHPAPLPEVTDEQLPAVSVIVYTKNEEERISDYISTIMGQNYPDFEVIIINDASIDNTAEIVETLQQDYPRLKYSFVPASNVNISSRKLAFTIGAKAASNPVLIMTQANSRIPSENWLRLMASPLADSSKELSLGISYYSPENQKGFGKWYRQFDSLTVLSQWAGAALDDKAYRGEAYGIAFRRDTFFKMDGFKASNRFVAGEDDIFVNSIARSGNTALIMNPEAQLEQLLPSASYPRLWLRAKERYAFTQRYLDTWALRRQAFFSLCDWVALLSAIAAVIFGLPSLIPLCFSLFILLLLWGYQICLYRRAAKVLHSAPLLLSVPLFWLLRPLINAFMRIRFRANKSSNYTWKHPK